MEEAADFPVNFFSDYSNNASDVNMCAFFFKFFDQQTRESIDLEEFTISFYDFDQSHADGAKAYVRETVAISGFTSLFVTNT